MGRSAAARAQRGLTGKALAEELQLIRNAASESEVNGLTLHHLEILFEGVQVAGVNFKDLFSDCMRVTETSVGIWKLPTRIYRAFNLAQYFLRSLSVPGLRVECGTLKGFSALLMSRLGKAVNPAFDGCDMHIVDSFEGLSDPKEQDAVAGRFPNARGAMACPLEHVQGVLSEFPQTHFHKGWIPEILAALPEAQWSFVHIDVDLYEPTRGCLEYFVPRLAPGGIIVNDDYFSPLFPGGGRAWDEFCKSNDLPFAALDSGQAVLVRPHE